MKLWFRQVHKHLFSIKQWVWFKDFASGLAVFVCYRAQPTTGAPATATLPTEIRPSALPGMTSVFEMNQASKHAAASWPSLKASWFKPLHLWVSEQNPNGSQRCLCGSAPRHFPEPMLPHPLLSPSSPKPRADRLGWGKNGASAVFPPANPTGLLWLTSSDRARGRRDARTQPGLGHYVLKPA